MGRKHKRTYEALFDKPVRKDIDWDDFLKLIKYLGGVVKCQSGSAHGIELNGEYAVFHKPHPGHEIYISELKRIRKFLKNAEIEHVE
ncbi:MAG: type II toxin-antitoxin system HicA family toxin [Anaerolineaceae bacterium]